MVRNQRLGFVGPERSGVAPAARGAAHQELIQMMEQPGIGVVSGVAEVPVTPAGHKNRRAGEKICEGVRAASVLVLQRLDQTLIRLIPGLELHQPRLPATWFFMTGAGIGRNGRR